MCKISFLTFIFCAISMLLAACTEEVKNPKYSEQSLKNSSYEINRTRSVEDMVKEIVVYGFNAYENLDNKKVILNSKVASATGLQSGSIYIARYERFTITIPLNNQVFFDNDDKNSNCGLRSEMNPSGDDYISLERGYTQISQTDTKVVLETYLYHIISDLYGRSLNVYYPCTPDQIEWKGTIYEF